MTALKQNNFKVHFTELLYQATEKILPPNCEIFIELARPKQVEHGDYSSNIALQLARFLHKSPKEIAQSLLQFLPDSPFLEKAEVAGNGFINLFLKQSAKQQFLLQVLQQGDLFGATDVGKRKQIQVEFVSANPTGPLHVGHGRGAAYGASLANILRANGYSVTREYYVNDAGRQMDILTLSTWLRYLVLCGVSIPFPGNAYQGEYVIDMAKMIKEAHGDRYVHQSQALIPLATPIDASSESNEDEQLDKLIQAAKEILSEDYSYIHQFVLTEQLGDCRNDLMEFGVEFDTWFSEQSLFDNGLITKAITTLEKNHMTYQQDGALWFRSTRFGDEKDRVIQRENGQYTYFASDIAYHLNKFERGFSHIINVWGADHHGYIPRVKGAMQALSLDPKKLEIALVQFAVLYRDGKKASMSTRSGEFVTLRELRKEVGNDAARFFYVLRKSDQHLDFDLDLAKSQSNDNPVYYVQYAHARINSVITQWGEEISTLSNAPTNWLSNEEEFALIQKLIDYPDTLEAAAKERAPHFLAFYLKDLAGAFHSYYNSTRFLVPEQELKLARMALIVAIQQVIANGLDLLGVSAPNEM